MPQHARMCSCVSKIVSALQYQTADKHANLLPNLHLHAFLVMDWISVDQLGMTDLWILGMHHCTCMTDKELSRANGNKAVFFAP